MQLFISDEFSIQNKNVIIEEERIVKQLRKVLRAKSGYIFYLQNKTGNIKRYKLEVIEIKNKVYSQILEIEELTQNNNQKGVIMSILNKFDKMELAVQKLTEIGIDKIYFVPTERSVFKTIKENKLERFYKIALEATEQSWGTYLPDIKVLSSIKDITGNIAILDFDGVFYKEVDFSNIDYFFIGPEGGFTEKDKKQIETTYTVSLGKKVLRAETAAIVSGFILNSGK